MEEIMDNFVYAKEIHCSIDDGFMKYYDMGYDPKHFNVDYIKEITIEEIAGKKVFKITAK